MLWGFFGLDGIFSRKTLDSEWVKSISNYNSLWNWSDCINTTQKYDVWNFIQGTAVVERMKLKFNALESLLNSLAE